MKETSETRAGTHELTGTVAERFVILRILGAGGMREV
jgi:hypothetical protein